jgi:CRP/FNR family transcriptional regulator, cyclic AMP receptor protein
VDEQRLKTIPLFASLGRRERRRVAQLADEVDVREGKELLHEGAYAYEFMVIEDGRAEVMRDGEHVADLGPGDFLGEVGALERATRNASVVARSPMSLMVLNARDMRDLAGAIPEFGQTLRETASTRHPVAQAG